MLLFYKPVYRFFATNNKSLKKCLIRKVSYNKMSRKLLDDSYLKTKAMELPPSLRDDKHKGEAGRIGVFGGSFQYTGAPYYAAISSLKTGADLVYVFCAKEAGTVIKSYSPELIVLPCLDDTDVGGIVEPWLDRLHVVIIGPGLGRDKKMFDAIKTIFRLCRGLKIPLVIDADGLFFLSEDVNLIKDYPNVVILTPNVSEFDRLVKDKKDGTPYERASDLFSLCPNLTILRKGRDDYIFNSKVEAKIIGGGSGRRSGGQGDLLSGSLATFLGWAMNNMSFQKNSDDTSILAAYAACILIRNCNAKSFAKLGRSMTALDMVSEIHSVFDEEFENM